MLYARHRLNCSRTTSIGFCAAAWLARGRCSRVGGFPRFGGRSAVRRPAQRISEYLGAGGPATRKASAFWRLTGRVDSACCASSWGKSQRPKIATCNVSPRGSAPRGNIARRATCAMRRCTLACRTGRTLHCVVPCKSRIIAIRRATVRPIASSCPPARLPFRSVPRWRWPMPVGPWKGIPT